MSNNANNIVTKHRPSPLPVINLHNTKVFEGYEAAMTALHVRDLHSGEIAFAYYSDGTNESGISVLMAVGPLNKGDENILFKSGEEIDEILDRINERFSGVEQLIIDTANERYSEIESNVGSRMSVLANDISVRQNQSTEEVLDNVRGDLTEIRSQFNAISTDAKVYTDSLEEKIAEKLASMEDVNFHNKEVLEQLVVDIKNELIVEIKKCLDYADAKVAEISKENNDYVDTTKGEIFTIVDSSIVGLKLYVDVQDASIVSYVDRQIVLTDSSLRMVDSSLREIIRGLRNDVSVGNQQLKDIIIDIETALSGVDSSILGALTAFDTSLVQFVNQKVSEATALVSGENASIYQHVDDKLQDVLSSLAIVEEKIDIAETNAENERDNIRESITESIKDVSDNLSARIKGNKEYIDSKTEGLNVSINDFIRHSNGLSASTYTHFESSIINISTNVGNIEKSLLEKLKELEDEFHGIDTEHAEDVSAIRNEILKAKNEVKTYADASVVSLYEKLSAEDSSIVQYVDNQDRILSDRITQLDDQFISISNAHDGHVESTQRIIADLSTRVSRTDASIVGDLTSFVNSSLSRFRDEVYRYINVGNANLTETIKDVSDYAHDVEDTLVRNVDTINRHINTSHGEILDKISSEKDILVRQINDTSSTVVETMNVSLGNVVSHIDSSYVFIDSKINDNSLGLHNALDASVEQINRKIDSQDASIVNAYENLVGVRVDELNVSIGNVITQIEELNSSVANHIDASVRVLDERISSEREIFNASINQKFEQNDAKIDDTSSDIHREIEEKYTTLDEKIGEVESDIIDELTVQIRNVSSNFETFAHRYNQTQSGWDTSIRKAVDVLRGDVSAVFILEGNRMADISTMVKNTSLYVEDKFLDAKNYTDAESLLRNAEDASIVELIRQKDNALNDAIHDAMVSSQTYSDGKHDESIAYTDSQITEINNAITGLSDDVREYSDTKDDELKKAIDSSILDMTDKMDEIEDAVNAKVDILSNKLFGVEDGANRDYVIPRMDVSINNMTKLMKWKRLGNTVIF